MYLQFSVVQSISSDVCKLIISAHHHVSIMQCLFAISNNRGPTLFYVINIFFCFISWYYTSGILLTTWLYDFVGFFSRYSIYDLESDGMYIVDLNISLCFESASSCDLDVEVFKQTVLKKRTCPRYTGFLQSGKSKTYIHVLSKVGQICINSIYGI